MTIIKTNAQKTVFTMLVLTLFLEFGSLTKVQKIWTLAFTSATGGNSFGTFGSQQKTTGGSSFGTFSSQVQPTTHPVVNV